MAEKMGIDFDSQPIVRAAREREDYTFAADETEVVGDDIEVQQFVPADPLLINFMPKFMARFSRFLPRLKV